MDDTNNRVWATLASTRFIQKVVNPSGALLRSLKISAHEILLTGIIIINSGHPVPLHDIHDVIL